jgi:endonuclease-3
VNQKLNYLKEYEKEYPNSATATKPKSNSKSTKKTPDESQIQQSEPKKLEENTRNKKNLKDKKEKESYKIFKPKNPHQKTPKNFYEQFQLIKEMRDYARAPVDDMGVECTIDSNTDRPTYKFQTLVSLILSAQTNDKSTFLVMKRLLGYRLTVDNIAKISEPDLVKLIYEVNFHNNKARSIINVIFSFYKILILVFNFFSSFYFILKINFLS